MLKGSDPAETEVAIDIKSSPGSEFGYRGLVEADVRSVQKLYEDSFPLRYGQVFYKELGQGKYEGRELLSLVSTTQEEDSEKEVVVASISSTLNDYTKDKYGQLIVRYSPGEKQSCCYVMTLAVTRKFRRSGVATELLRRTIAEAEKRPDCKVIYLHVITYNTGAMEFYKKNGFVRKQRIADFYIIKGKSYDSYIFAKYLNGGKPTPPRVSLWSSLMESFYMIVDYFFKQSQGTG